MTSRINMPRLLPATITMLAVVLVARSGILVRSVIDSGQPAAFIAAAWAAGPDAPKPGDYGQQIKPGPGTAKKPDPPIAAEIPPVPDGPPPMTDAEKTLLLELRDRRRELEAREATLESRESMLAAAEKKVSGRVEELQALQQRLESLDINHRQQENAAWQGLVKVYEDMKPRDAAVIFNDLGMPVLLSVIDRMKEAKAAAILAAMTPDKAREVTTQLAQLRTGKPAHTGT